MSLFCYILKISKHEKEKYQNVSEIKLSMITANIVLLVGGARCWYLIAVFLVSILRDSVEAGL